MSMSIASVTDAAPAAKLVYRVAEVAKILGISEQTVFNHLATGLIQGRKLGGATVVLHDDMMQMLRDLPKATYTLVPTNKKIMARDAERARKAKVAKAAAEAAQGIAA